MSASSAARGGAAIYAVHARSQADLDQLGLSLRYDDMKDLSDSDRCRYILDHVLGAPGSPDEEVLRRATLEALKEHARDPNRTIEESITIFMSAFVYETALVELTSHRAAKTLTPDQVLKHEKSLKQYIRGQAKYSGVGEVRNMSVSSLLNSVAKFRDKAMNLLRRAIS